MSKKLRIVISVIITIAVLGTGAGVVLADDNANSNRKPAVVPAEALNKALEKLVADGTITADQVTQIKEQLSKELEQSIDPGQLLKRLLSIQDETKLDDALASLVKEGKITTEQAGKIKEQWKAQQERIRFAETLKRLIQLKTEGELDTALNTLLSEGKITEAQAGKIKEQWKAQQERLRFT
jgi:polyhydroxyalkanoate synthesis regulator phasin